MASVDLTGQKFGRLTALYDTGKKTASRNCIWMCKCECGNSVEVDTGSLRSQHTKSCGCWISDRMSKLNFKHGGSKDRLFEVWLGMHKRCTDRNSPQFKNYGGRGITVGPEFKEYEDFKRWAYANGYDENAKRGECTLDRIDVNGNYEPSNCRWVGYDVQANNRRTNDLISFNGKTMTRSQWERELGFGRGVLAGRIRSGWAVERMLTEPPQKRRSPHSEY